MLKKNTKSRAWPGFFLRCSADTATRCRICLAQGFRRQHFQIPAHVVEPSTELGGVLYLGFHHHAALVVAGHARIVARDLPVDQGRTVGIDATDEADWSADILVPLIADQFLDIEILRLGRAEVGQLHVLDVIERDTVDLGDPARTGCRAASALPPGSGCRAD